MQTNPPPRIVVFDIGGVLIEWDPRHLYRKLFEDDERAMENFLSEVCSPGWNLEQDRGRAWEDAVRELTQRHPDKAELIAAYHLRWEEMVPGPIPGTPDLLRILKEQGTPLYAITNFSAEKLALARRRFDFLNLFEGMIVSGEERMVKPDPAIYRRLLGRYGLDAPETLFIDDVARNVEAARAVGMQALHFTGADVLRRDLAGLGLL